MDVFVVSAACVFLWESTNTLIVPTLFFEVLDSKQPGVVTSSAYYELLIGIKVEKKPSSFFIQLNSKLLESDPISHSLQSL